MRREVLMLSTMFLAAGCAGGHGGATPADTAHVNAMSHEHAAETPAANASAAAPRVPVTGQEVSYGTVGGRETRGYMAFPTSAGANAALPGVLMIHEWWGLNENVRMMARRLAGEGYRVLAVDMYGGQVATTPEQARQAMMQVMQNRPGGIENLRAAADFLRGRGAAKVGVIGWCFGGGWSLQTALQLGDKTDAAAVYYGQPVTDRAELQKLNDPLIGFFGTADTGIPVATVRQMEQEMKSLGKNVEFHYYEGAAHAFANPSGQSYNEAAASDSWRRTVSFFARTLKS
ncbi:MAG TPA: dienelactone hydrolase family protein [Longimicrobium sp.]|jgi:carboxymethylenebutenolidase